MHHIGEYDQICRMFVHAALHKVAPPVSWNHAEKLKKLERVVIITAFLNFFLVSALGILLRVIPLLDSFPLLYKNILHAHSHFAFGGWLMPVLLVLISRYFPELRQAVSYSHWRNVHFLFLLSAYGMLFTFPFMGYQAASIIFSTLSVAAGFYLVIVVRRVLKQVEQTASVRFLQAGLVYMAISSAGPFATGPLIAMGQQGSVLYFNSIYFYLHLQINGWFVFAILAFLYAKMEKAGSAAYGKKSFTWLNLAILPTFLLSVLWSRPSLLYNYIGGLAALVQLAGLAYLLKDFVAYKKRPETGSWMVVLIAVFALKVLLQLLSALPEIATMAYQYKNFIIAFLHLVLLGFVSLFIISEFQPSAAGKNIMKFFFTGFIITETVLVLQAFLAVANIPLPYFREQMLLFSLIFPFSILMMIRNIIRTPLPVLWMKHDRSGG